MVTTIKVTPITKRHLAQVSRGQARKKQAGFSLVEVMIAGAIITIGLLAVLGLFGTALGATQASQMDEIAHARATQILESVYTARQTSQSSWDAINYTTTTSPSGVAGIFTPGLVPLTDPGPDGLDGTADDVAPAPIILPGPDGKLGTPPGTGDDLTLSLAAFRRQIQITNAKLPSGADNPNLKIVTITIQYPGAGGRISNYTLQTLISSFH